MPNLVDIMEVAEALESKAVYLAVDRCVAVRNRHASCRRCTDACPMDAVHAEHNVLSIDTERCVACGALHDRLPDGGSHSASAARRGFGVGYCLLGGCRRRTGRIRLRAHRFEASRRSFEVCRGSLSRAS